jgi:hypothetical protein
VQGDAGRNITGEILLSNDAGGIDVTATGAFGDTFTPPGSEDSGSHVWDRRTNIVLNTSLVTPTANENRPVNTAVRYLMRALP